MKKIKSGLAMTAAMIIAASLQAATTTVIFTGASGVDNNFSTVANWSAFPASGDSVVIAVTNINGVATSAGNPAKINAGWTNTFGTAKIYSQTGYGQGTAYAEVMSGGLLKASNLEVGNSGNAAFDGTLTLRSGGSIDTTANNTGSFKIGGETSGMVGNMIVEAGAALFRESSLNLFTNGTLTFMCNSNSLSTLNTVRTTAGTNNLLNGLIQVDLAALTGSCTNTLINSSSSSLQIAGSMRAWLDSLGGSISGTGTYSSANFAVLNGGLNEWTLSLADSNQDITLAVTYNASYTLTVSNGTGGGSYTNGQQVTIAANPPAPGWIFDQWTGDTQYVAVVAASNTTIMMPAQAISLTATYIEIIPAYTLTGNAAGGGTVSPASTNVLAGSSATFVITASNNYRIVSLTTNGTAVAGMVFDNDSVVTNFIWSDVQAAGTLVATFTNRTSESRVFTGNSGTDNNFSTAGNWTKKPLYGDSFLIGVTNATAATPAIIDSGFSTVIANAKIYSTSNYGLGMAHAEIVSGGLLKSSSLSVGNLDTVNFNGTLTLRKGGSIDVSFLNSGGFTVGGETNGSVGNLFVEAGATLFRHSRVQLASSGTMTFISDTNSFSTLNMTRTTAGTNNILNGLLRADLTALAASCTNTLINSSSTNLLIGGVMRTWLDGLGGSISGTGTYSSANFAVLNGGLNEWTLALADGNQDLTLSVTYHASYTLTVNSGSGSGLYTNGAQAAIAATSIPGKTFIEWTGDTAYLDNSNSASATVTMPATNVALTATYTDNLYTLTVNNGSGSGSAYTNGQVVPITADAPASGYAFAHWSGDAAYLADSNAASTTVTMPLQAVTVTATYIATEQYTTNGTPYSWLTGYGLTNYEADAVFDQDNDGLKAWQEYIAGTNPTNAASVLKAAQATRNVVTWSAVSGRVYSVYWSTNLVKGFTNLADNIVYPQGSYTNTIPDARVNHYQVKVRLP